MQEIKFNKANEKLELQGNIIDNLRQDLQRCKKILAQVEVEKEMLEQEKRILGEELEKALRHGRGRVGMTREGDSLIVSIERQSQQLTEIQINQQMKLRRLNRKFWVITVSMMLALAILTVFVALYIKDREECKEEIEKEKAALEKQMTLRCDEKLITLNDKYKLQEDHLKLEHWSKVNEMNAECKSKVQSAQAAHEKEMEKNQNEFQKTIDEYHQLLLQLKPTPRPLYRSDAGNCKVQFVAFLLAVTVALLLNISNVR